MEYRYATLAELGDMAAAHPELAADRPDLCRPAFPGNPVVGEAAFPFLFYAVEAGRVVGSRKAVPDRAIVNGREYAWAWCFDTIVDASQRGRGVGSRLVELQVEAFDRLGVTTSAAFSAPAMMRIYEKCGYRVLEFVPRMVLVRNPAPFLAGKIGHGVVARAAGGLGALLLRGLAGIRGARRSRAGHVATPIDPAGFARLFAHAAAPEQPNSWALSPDWVTSRLQPGDEPFKLTCRGAAAPCALFVLRPRAPDPDGGTARRLTLMYFKFLTEGVDVAEGLAAELTRQLFARPLDAADIVTSSPSLLAALRKRGYRRRGTGMTFVYRPPPGTEIAGARDIADWQLTHFCSDGFLFG
jgi:GNAT superfamily N-acetyltransferase